MATGYLDAVLLTAKIPSGRRNLLWVTQFSHIASCDESPVPANRAATMNDLRLLRIAESAGRIEHDGGARAAEGDKAISVICE